MYKDSSCRSSTQPTPPKATPETAINTTTTASDTDANTVVTTTSTTTTTATSAEPTASAQHSEAERNASLKGHASKSVDDHTTAAAAVSERSASSEPTTINTASAAASTTHNSLSSNSNTPITLSLAAEHLEAEYYQLSCASDCSVSSTSSSGANTSCSGSDDSDENSEVYTFRARPAFPAHLLYSASKRRAKLRREHAPGECHIASALDADSRRGSAVSGLSNATGVSGGSSSRRHRHKHHTSISADVRVLRKIGYIASRVRFLAKIYGDFKLINPYSPAKQRKQLQDILLRHSIPDTDRKGAAAASGYRTKNATTAYDSATVGAATAAAAHTTHTAAATDLASQRNTTPDSALTSSAQAVVSACVQETQVPHAEEETALSSLEDDDEEETSATFTAATVRRKSSVLVTGGDENLTAQHSLAVLEELLVQLYEQRQHRITVIRRRQQSRRGSKRGNGKIAANCKQQSAPQPQQLIIMSGGSAVGTESNVGQQLLRADAVDIEQQTNLRNANNLYNSSDIAADNSSVVSASASAAQLQSSATAGVSVNIANTASSQAKQKPPQAQQQRSYSNAFLQPFSIGGGCMDRRRRASDCSTHPSSQQLLQQQLLSNQLQVTLKNNNYTIGGGKFPYHRGSCGGAGEHLLAANSIANRSTIILSKSCSNVEGAPTAHTGVVGGVGSGGNANVSRKLSLGGQVDAANNGNLVSPAALTPSPTAKQPQLAATHTTSPQAQSQQQQQPTAGGPGSNGNNEYNIVQLNNTIIQCHFNDEDFRALVKDLKRKVEYTERMNWLCEYQRK